MPNQLMQEALIVPGKVGIFGEQGVGKTTTAAILSAALSKELHNGAPVWATDPELGWQFPKHRVFRAEKIEFVQRTVPTFKAMLADMREAEKAGACVYNVELAKIWLDLLRTVQKNCGDRWGSELVKMWNEYVTFFLNSKMHCIALARVSDLTEDVLNEEGDIKRIKVGEGMKAGGQRNNFGYEPHLVLRMSLEQKPRRKKGKLLEDEGRMMHRACVFKDRTWAINGRVFRWSDRDSYEPGDYRFVWQSLRPFFRENQAIGQFVTIDANATSDDLIDDTGRSEFRRDQQDRAILLETFDAELDLLYGGRDAKNTRARSIVGYEFTGTLSRTELEQRARKDELRQAVDYLHALKERIKAGDFPQNDADLRKLCDLAKEDVRSPGKKKSLNEVLLEESMPLGRIAV